jgi:hypothetical protein
LAGAGKRKHGLVLRMKAARTIFNGFALRLTDALLISIKLTIWQMSARLSVAGVKVTRAQLDALTARCMRGATPRWPICDRHDTACRLDWAARQPGFGI